MSLAGTSLRTWVQFALQIWLTPHFKQAKELMLAWRHPSASIATIKALSVSQFVKSYRSCASNAVQLQLASNAPDEWRGARNWSLCGLSFGAAWILAEAVDPVEAELFIREAEDSDTGIRAATASTRIDNGVAHATIIHPACITAVKKLELPGCIELTHLSHCCTITLTRLHCLDIIYLLKAFKEVHLA